MKPMKSEVEEGEGVKWMGTEEGETSGDEHGRCIIALYTCNSHNLINLCHPNRFNFKNLTKHWCLEYRKSFDKSMRKGKKKNINRKERVEELDRTLHRGGGASGQRG